jgi:iron(III) transport system ATP-binding protein
MEGGRIAQEGSPESLYEKPASRFLADFIGDANLVDGEFSAGIEGPRFAASNVSVPVTGAQLPPGAATLAVRPNRLRVTPQGQGLLPGELKRAAYLGSRVEYVVATPWGELLVFDDGARNVLPRGSAVGLTFDPDAVIVLPRTTA